MRVTAADADLAPPLRQTCGVLVRALEHVAVLDFNGGEVVVKPVEVLELAEPGHTGEDMIDAEEKPFLGEVHQKRHEIGAPLQKLNVLPFADVVDADVHLGAAGHPAGQLFADEEIRMAAQFFGALDRVMIGKREQIHAPALQHAVDFFRIAVTFSAKISDKGGRTGSGEV